MAYVTDSLWAHGEGKRLADRWQELVAESKTITESAESIIESVIGRAGLEVTDESA